MKRNMGVIQFESRSEIDEVMKAIAEYVKQNPKEKNNEILQEFYYKLKMMHMVW